MYLAGLFSQASFALTLALLAWSDRRSRGLVWLAGACGLQLMSTFLRAAWRGSTPWLLDAAIGCLLMLMFFFVYLGLRPFVTRRKLTSTAGPVAVSTCMAAVLAVAPLSALWSQQLAQLGAVAIMVVTVVMLWKTRIAGLRRTARLTAALLTGTAIMFLLRVVLDARAANTRLGFFAHYGSMFCATLLALSFIAIFVAETKRRLHDETRLDPLTGLRNRRAMEEMAAQHVRLTESTGRPLALLMMDLDCFKLLNDTWGHSLGDRALRAVGGVLLTMTSGEDMVARMGGEEFAVLLPGRTITAAHTIAERLRATVAGLRLNEGDCLASFTVSIGVGILHAGETTWTEMLRRADIALYRAKREGRNRVVLCAEATGEQQHAAAEAGGWKRRTSAPPAAMRAVRDATERTEPRAMLR